MRRVVSSHNDHIDIMDILLNVIKGLIQKLDGSIALDTSVGLCLDRLGFGEAVFEMAADWEVAYVGGFLCVVEIEVNIG